VILVRLGIAEESLDLVRCNGGNRSAQGCDCGNGRILEIPGNFDQVFGFEVDGEPYRAHDLAT
jgi:hypothetical protein